MRFRLGVGEHGIPALAGLQTRFFEQDNRLGANGLFPADKPDPFPCLGFYADRAGVHAEQFGKTVSDLLLIGAEVRLLCEDNRVEVDNRSTFLSREFNREPQKIGGIASAVLFGGVGEVFPDIPRADRS